MKLVHTQNFAFKRVKFVGLCKSDKSQQSRICEKKDKYNVCGMPIKKNRTQRIRQDDLSNNILHPISNHQRS